MSSAEKSESDPGQQPGNNADGSFSREYSDTAGLKELENSSQKKPGDILTATKRVIAWRKREKALKNTKDSSESIDEMLKRRHRTSNRVLLLISTLNAEINSLKVLLKKYQRQAHIEIDSSILGRILSARDACIDICDSTEPELVNKIECETKIDEINNHISARYSYLETLISENLAFIKGADITRKDIEKSSANVAGELRNLSEILDPTKNVNLGEYTKQREQVRSELKRLEKERDDREATTRRERKSREDRLSEINENLRILEEEARVVSKELEAKMKEKEDAIKDNSKINVGNGFGNQRNIISMLAPSLPAVVVCGKPLPPLPVQTIGVLVATYRAMLNSYSDEEGRGLFEDLLTGRKEPILPLPQNYAPELETVEGLTKAAFLINKILADCAEKRTEAEKERGEVQQEIDRINRECNNINEITVPPVVDAVFATEQRTSEYVEKMRATFYNLVSEREHIESTNKATLDKLEEEHKELSGKIAALHQLLREELHISGDEGENETKANAIAELDANIDSVRRQREGIVLMLADMGINADEVLSTKPRLTNVIQGLPVELDETVTFIANFQDAAKIMDDMAQRRQIGSIEAGENQTLSPGAGAPITNILHTVVELYHSIVARQRALTAIRQFIEYQNAVSSSTLGLGQANIYRGRVSGSVSRCPYPLGVATIVTSSLIDEVVSGLNIQIRQASSSTNPKGKERLEILKATAATLESIRTGELQGDPADQASSAQYSLEYLLSVCSDNVSKHNELLRQTHSIIADRAGFALAAISSSPTGYNTSTAVLDLIRRYKASPQTMVDHYSAHIDGVKQVEEYKAKLESQAPSASGVTTTGYDVSRVRSSDPRVFKALDKIISLDNWLREADHIRATELAGASLELETAKRLAESSSNQRMSNSAKCSSIQIQINELQRRQKLIEAKAEGVTTNLAKIVGILNTKIASIKTNLDQLDPQWDKESSKEQGTGQTGSEELSLSSRLLKTTIDMEQIPLKDTDAGNNNPVNIQRCVSSSKTIGELRARSATLTLNISKLQSTGDTVRKIADLLVLHQRVRKEEWLIKFCSSLNDRLIVNRNATVVLENEARTVRKDLELPSTPNAEMAARITALYGRAEVLEREIALIEGANRERYEVVKRRQDELAAKLADLETEVAARETQIGEAKQELDNADNTTEEALQALDRDELPPLDTLDLQHANTLRRLFAYEDGELAKVVNTREAQLAAMVAKLNQLKALLVTNVLDSVLRTSGDFEQMKRSGIKRARAIATTISDALRTIDACNGAITVAEQTRTNETGKLGIRFPCDPTSQAQSVGVATASVLGLEKEKVELARLNSEILKLGDESLEVHSLLVRPTQAGYTGNSNNFTLSSIINSIEAGTSAQAIPTATQLNMFNDSEFNNDTHNTFTGRIVVRKPRAVRLTPFQGTQMQNSTSSAIDMGRGGIVSINTILTARQIILLLTAPGDPQAIATSSSITMKYPTNNISSSIDLSNPVVAANANNVLSSLNLIELFDVPSLLQLEETIRSERKIRVLKGEVSNFSASRQMQNTQGNSTTISTVATRPTKTATGGTRTTTAEGTHQQQLQQFQGQTTTTNECVDELTSHMTTFSVPANAVGSFSIEDLSREESGSSPSRSRSHSPNRPHDSSTTLGDSMAKRVRRCLDTHLSILASEQPSAPTLAQTQATVQLSKQTVGTSPTSFGKTEGGQRAPVRLRVFTPGDKVTAEMRTVFRYVFGLLRDGVVTIMKGRPEDEVLIDMDCVCLATSQDIPSGSCCSVYGYNQRLVRINRDLTRITFALSPSLMTSPQTRHSTFINIKQIARVEKHQGIPTPPGGSRDRDKVKRLPSVVLYIQRAPCVRLYSDTLSVDVLYCGLRNLVAFGSSTFKLRLAASDE